MDNMEESHHRLHVIYIKMQELHESTDTELIHGVADDLLIEAIEVLGEEIGGKEYMKPLIDSYNKLNKRYA